MLNNCSSPTRNQAFAFGLGSLFAGGVLCWLLAVQIQAHHLVALLVPTTVGVLIWLSRSKLLLSGCSLAVLLLAVASTLGVWNSDSQRTLVRVQGKRVDRYGGVATPDTYFPLINRYRLSLSTDVNPEDVRIVTVSEQFYKEVHLGDQVEVKYHHRAILGVVELDPVIDSVEGEPTVPSAITGFGGPWLDKLITGSSLLFGAIPLLYVMKNFLYYPKAKH